MKTRFSICVLSLWSTLTHAPRVFGLEPLLGRAVNASSGGTGILSLVNPFIGTTNGGNVFPGELLRTLIRTAVEINRQVQQYRMGL